MLATASPTITSQGVTEMGMILGSVAYMSPEQARGRPADKRSDVWAFGAVLYEMLSGERAFKGEDTSETLAAVLRQEIDWTALPTSTPKAVRRLIARCLDRGVSRRLRDIREARIVFDDPAIEDAVGVPGLAPPQPLWRRVVPVLVTAIVAGALAGTTAWYFKPSPPLAVTRLGLALPEDQAFTGTARHMIALSPDGAQIAYSANARLYLRPMSEQDSKEIQGSEGFLNVAEPVFSPDGRSIAFYATADQTIKTIPASGGVAVTICGADLPSGMSWGPSGIVFAESGKGIRRVSPDGGTPEVLVSLQDGEVPERPQILPGGGHVLFTIATGTRSDRWDKAHIVAQSLSSGERRVLIDGGSDARYLSTGHLVYAVSGSLFPVPFDMRRLQATGSPVRVVTGERRR